MKKTKKSLFMVLVTALILGVTLPSTSFASTKVNSETETKEKLYEEELSDLTQEEINSNFERIDKEYVIGEQFSIKDQTFIEMYAKPMNTGGMTIFKTSKVSASKTVKGITVKINGAIKDDIQNVINQSFGAINLKTSTTAGASKVTSVKTVVNHNAYGLVGSDGVGKVYSGSVSTTGKNSTLDSTKKYTAIVAYASTWATVTVNHTGGSFTINP